MPRVEHLPTPASSTEIKGKDGSQFSSLQMSFELPPPAVAGGGESRPSTASTKDSTGSSYHPSSPKSPVLPPSEVVKIRRRSSVAQTPNKDSFALPPPPTRSRKIIQMKPKAQPEEHAETPAAEGPKNNGAGKASPAKKKQPSSTSVAGRKIARKTAHSLIERRRRSKMNEEFGVLKDMIPACTGEMHKLAILQASIDYVRYLEDCVAKLKAENKRTNPTPAAEQQFLLPPPAAKEQYNSSSRPYSASYGEDEDVEMCDSERPSPSMPRSSQRPSESPALLPQDNTRHRQDSYSSEHARHYSFSTSSTTSPSLGPTTTAYDYARSAASASTLTSPALPPQRDLDQEATAALLMLNTDRRGTQGGSPAAGARGMSVKDLLIA